jgi:hypothetical protein
VKDRYLSTQENVFAVNQRLLSYFLEMADPKGDGTFTLTTSIVESGQSTMSTRTDGNVEAQKRALIHIVCFALNAGTFGVAALNATLCNPCFLQRMCFVFANGVADLVHEFARCESFSLDRMTEYLTIFNTNN